MNRPRINKGGSSLPTYIDKEIINAKRKMGREVSHWLNCSLVPLCRECGVQLTDDNYSEFIEDYENVGDVYINLSVENIDNEFLADTVRENAKRKFAELLAKYDAKPPRMFSFYILGIGTEQMYPATVYPYIILRDGIFDVNEKQIVTDHTHLVNVDSGVYRRVEAMCNDINAVFSSIGFDQNLLLAMLYYNDDGKITPNLKFNYRILK